MAEQQRKIVFVLGAGASYGAGAYASVQHGGKLPIPMQSTFWESFLRFCESKENRRRIESFLFRYFMGYARMPARVKLLKRWSMLRDVSVEEVFTFLSERVQAPSTSSSLRLYVEKIWSALVYELPRVFSRYKANKRTRGVYKKLVNNFVRSRDTVVSFNYDTVFEDSVPQKWRWHYEGVIRKKRSIGILKPHGSTNWENSDPVVVSSSPHAPLIVAPTHLKFVQTRADHSEMTAGYLDQTGVSKVWALMEREMREAKALVFIGYSFPEGDLYFSSILRSVLADRDGTPAVVIVNPDALAIRERLSKRFALDRIDLNFDMGGFVEGSRRNLLDRLRTTN